MRRSAISALVAGAALVFAPTVTSAQDAAAPDVITIRVCNNTSGPVRVAVAYQPVGQSRFYNEGWYGVEARACADLARTENAFSYVYAEVANDGAQAWGGSHRHCVQYPGPYAFWSGNAGVCAAGQQARNFAVIEMERWGVFTWTLDP